LVAGTERLLLHDRRQGLRNHGSSCPACDHPSNAFSNTATDTATNSPCNAARHAAANSATASTANSAARPSWTCRSVQLRCWTVFCLGGEQAAVVLQFPSHLRAANRTTSSSRSLQLRGWFRQLAGGLVSAEEGMVLQDSWQGLPWSDWRWVRHIFGALRLQCRFRQLDAGLVRREESMVLLQQGQGLPSSSWRMCLSSDFGVNGDGCAGHCAIFRRHFQHDPHDRACLSEDVVSAFWCRRLRHLPTPIADSSS